MNIVKKRLGVMARLDGYQLDRNDTEGQTIVDQYRTGHDELAYMDLQEAQNETLGEGNELLFDIDTGSGVAMSPAEKVQVRMASTGNISPPAKPQQPNSGNTIPDTATVSSNGGSVKVPTSTVNNDNLNVNVRVKQQQHVSADKQAIPAKQF